MSYIETQKNIAYLGVAKDQDHTIAAATKVTSYASLADGDVVWVNPANEIVDTGALNDAASYSKLRLIQRSGTSLITSPFINAMSVKGYTIGTYTAPTEQLDYIGYNGTGGSIDDVVSNTYMMRLHVDNHRQRIVKHGVYKSAASTSEGVIVDGLILNLEANCRPDPGSDQLFKIERLSAHAGEGASTTGTWSVINGSPFVVASADVDNGGLVLGDYLRIGAVDTTGPVYKVVSLDTTNNVAELDIPYQGTTNTAVAANVVEHITAAHYVGAAAGIKITGLPLSYTRGRSMYSKVAWTLELGGFGTTTVTYSSKATAGNGTYYQVAEMEDFLQGNEGNTFRQTNWGPPATRRVDALAAETYDVMKLNFLHEEQSSLGSVANSSIQYVVAIAIQAAQGDNANTGIATVADYWLVTSQLVPGLTAQVSNLTA